MHIVSIKKCENYDEKEIKDCLLESISHLGGLEKYIQKGEKTLLKVNLLMRSRPEAAVTVHPIFVKVLAGILKEYGADVYIGDSPGGPFNEKALAGIYKQCGMWEVAQQCGVLLNQNFNAAEVSNPNGIFLKRFVVCDMVTKVDKIISVSKFKTHSMALMTGAVKNMFGIVPGTMKAEYHLNMPVADDFANALVDICQYAAPVLSFMDGIWGMEGNGPSGGDRRHVNAILASDSPYHLDVCAATMMNVKPLHVPTIKMSAERNLCAGDLSDIKMMGEAITDLIMHDFITPSIRMIYPLEGKLPGFMNRFIQNMLRPRPVFLENCVGCKICYENCPPKCITMSGGNKASADLNKCIRCYCCQELCPQKAIKVHRPWLLDRLAKW